MKREIKSEFMGGAKRLPKFSLYGKERDLLSSFPRESLKSPMSLSVGACAVHVVYVCVTRSKHGVAGFLGGCVWPALRPLLSTCGCAAEWFSEAPVSSAAFWVGRRWRTLRIFHSHGGCGGRYASFRLFSLPSFSALLCEHIIRSGFMLSFLVLILMLSWQRTYFGLVHDILIWCGNFRLSCSSRAAV